MHVKGFMTRLIPFLTTLLLRIQVQDVVAESTGKLIGDLRVVGGTDAPELPTLAFTTGSKLCAATLIHPDILLTAAHCAGIFIQSGIFLGGTTVDGSSGSTLYEVESELPNPNYDIDTDANDIMLVKLRRPTDVTPQEINFDALFPTDGTEATVIGFGATVEGGLSSFTLQQASIPIVPFDECDSFWNKLEDATQLCAGLSDGSRDSCQGDSGGPLLVDNVLVGIVSFGLGCGRPDTPSVYARVSGFQDFIETGICDLSSVPPSTCSVATPLNTPVGAPVSTPINGPEAPATSPITSPLTAPILLPTSAPVVLPVASSVAPVTSPNASPVSAPISSPIGSPVPAPAVLPIGAPEVLPVASSTVAPINTPIAVVEPVNPPVDTPKDDSPTLSPSTSSGPVDATTRSSSPEMIPTIAPLTSPASSPVVPVVTPMISPTSSPATTPTLTLAPNLAPDATTPLAPLAPASTPVVVTPAARPNAPTSVAAPSVVVEPPAIAVPTVKSPVSTSFLSETPSIILGSKKGMGMKMMSMYGMFHGSHGDGTNSTGISGKYSGKGKGNNFNGNYTSSGKGMGRMMNVGTNTTDDNLIQLLEEDSIQGGKGGGKGGMYSMSGNVTRGNMNSVQGDSNNRGKGAQRDKRGPEGLTMGMMMTSSDSDTVASSMPPKSKRNMFRLNRNSSNPSNLMQNIMHGLHHSNVSVMEQNHTFVKANRTEANSTIGHLMEGLRRGFHQGFHHGDNETTFSTNSSNSQTQFSINKPDDTNEEKYPRLYYLWDILTNSIGSNRSDGNETASMIGTKIWKWFNEKN